MARRIALATVAAIFLMLLSLLVDAFAREVFLSSWFGHYLWAPDVRVRGILGAVTPIAIFYVAARILTRD